MQFRPSCGHVRAGGQKAISVSLEPFEKMEAKNVQVDVKIQKIEYESGEDPASQMSSNSFLAEDWDDSMQITVPPWEDEAAAEKKGLEDFDNMTMSEVLGKYDKQKTKPEPGHRVARSAEAAGGDDGTAAAAANGAPSDEFEWDMPLKLSATSDERGFECEVKFHPMGVSGPDSQFADAETNPDGRLRQKFRLRTLPNLFEDVAIELVGDGYVQEVCWDFSTEKDDLVPADVDELDCTNLGGDYSPGGGHSPLSGGAMSPGVGGATHGSSSLPESGIDFRNLSPRSLEKAKKHLLRLPAPPDELDLGEILMGEKKTRTFFIKNTGEKHPIRFEFPETLPAPFDAVHDPTTSTGASNGGG
jgi:hypothetical protein